MKMGKSVRRLPPAKCGGMMTATVAVIYKAKIYFADVPVDYRVLYGFFYEGDETLVRAAKALFGIPPTAETKDFVHADYVIDIGTGEMRSAKATKELFMRRVKEEARHMEIINMLMEAM